MERVHNGKTYKWDELQPSFQQNNDKLDAEWAAKLRNGTTSTPLDWQASFLEKSIDGSLKKNKGGSVPPRKTVLYVLAILIAASGFIGGLTVYGGVRIVMGAVIAVAAGVSERGDGSAVGQKLDTAEKAKYTYYSYTVDDKFIVEDVEDKHFIVICGVNVLVDKEIYTSCDYGDTVTGVIAPTSDGFYFSVNKF